MFRLALLTLLLVPLRTWTDSTGRHSTEAELVGFHGGAAYLHREGATKAVPLARLSEADQRFVRNAYSYQILTGKVVGIADGDTLTLLVDKDQHRIRLEGIDAPEARQDFGNKAKQALGDYAFGKAVTVEYLKTDQYGRILGHVFVDGQWINRLLLTDGMAWHFTKYNKSPLLAAAESEAREAKRGLWGDGKAIPPWNYRNPPAETRPPPTDLITSSIAPKGKPAATSGDVTVYVTESGDKYHRESCQYLKKSKRAIPLSEASGYQPCSRCKPPRN